MAQGLEKNLSAYLDTHVAVWLHAGLAERLSAAAMREIEDNDLLISPMVLLEFQHLYERKRIAVEPAPLFGYLSSTFGVVLCDYPFAAVALEAASINWMTDPFDRIIVGQASANHTSMLITADPVIRRHYGRAIW